MTKCTKCDFEGETRTKFDFDLCNICFMFSPDNEQEFEEYVKEKVPASALDSFRKYFKKKGELQKNGMLKLASEGESMSRPPFGYKYENGKLVPAENFGEVEEIFEDFLNNDMSLRQLSKKRSFSVNGLKKILTNFTYIGRIRFDNQTYPGNHKPIVSSTLFNRVQDKIDRLGIKRP